MKLIVIGSSSKGNSYALQADSGEILLLEAGMPLIEVKRAIGYKTSKVVGCIISHIHGDHAKYATDYIDAGIEVYSNEDVAEKIVGVKKMAERATINIGSFRIAPFYVHHDVPDFGYLIFHVGYGSIFFATDCYNLDQVFRGCKCYLMECNYSDALLNKAVAEGKTPAKQADRVRLSHMSMEHAIDWLMQCEADKFASNIILIHGSARHLNPEQAISKFQQVIGVPTYYAKPQLSLNI